jgi:hypothetical protein
MRTPAWMNRAARALAARPGLTTLAAAAVGAAVLAGCAANDPFDPDSIANYPPTVRISAEPVDPDGELQPTSYYNRRINWSGTDRDGFVVEYYVSIRSDAAVPAPWDTTTRTDTTMTFVTDESGNAEATVLVACRDDRGAYSDTLQSTIPLRNFPPTVGFLRDYDPKKNMQRIFLDAEGNEITNPADPAIADTVYWNWGAMNFRLFAVDLDGMETVEPYYLYTVADGDPGEIVDEGQPGADPNTVWVRAPFDAINEVVAEFEIFVVAEPSEARTLKVIVNDEANAGEPFEFSWEVRPPAGPVLYIPDNSSTATADLFRSGLAEHLGEGGWDEYDFWFGVPDKPEVLIETLRKFEAVLWTDGGAASANIRAGTSVPNGFLTRYLDGSGGAQPGRLFIASRVLTGPSTGITPAFLNQYLGIKTSALPLTPLRYPSGQTALGLQEHLPDMTTIREVTVGGVGLDMYSANTEAIWQFEYCTCYGDPRRPVPPFDPFVGVRYPSRAIAQYARTVGIGLQLDNFDNDQVRAAIGAVLGEELGVNAR